MSSGSSWWRDIHLVEPNKELRPTALAARRVRDLSTAARKRRGLWDVPYSDGTTCSPGKSMPHVVGERMKIR